MKFCIVGDLQFYGTRNVVKCGFRKRLVRQRRFVVNVDGKASAGLCVTGGAN